MAPGVMKGRRGKRQKIGQPYFMFGPYGPHKAEQLQLRAEREWWAAVLPSALGHRSFWMEMQEKADRLMFLRGLLSREVAGLRGS